MFRSVLSCDLRVPQASGDGGLHAAEHPTMHRMGPFQKGSSPELQQYPGREALVWTQSVVEDTGEPRPREQERGAGRGNNVSVKRHCHESLSPHSRWLLFMPLSEATLKFSLLRYLSCGCGSLDVPNQLKIFTIHSQFDGWSRAAQNNLVTTLDADTLHGFPRLPLSWESLDSHIHCVAF